MNSEQASVWRLTGSPCEHAIILHSDTNVALSIALLFQVKGFAAEVACDYVDALERSGCVFRGSWTRVSHEAGQVFRAKLDSRSAATQGFLFLL